MKCLTKKWGQTVTASFCSPLKTTPAVQITYFFFKLTAAANIKYILLHAVCIHLGHRPITSSWLCTLTCYPLTHTSVTVHIPKWWFCWKNDWCDIFYLGDEKIQKKTKKRKLEELYYCDFVKYDVQSMWHILTHGVWVMNSPEKHAGLHTAKCERIWKDILVCHNCHNAFQNAGTNMYK